MSWHRDHYAHVVSNCFFWFWKKEEKINRCAVLCYAETDAPRYAMLCYAV